jgi:hypothetical protein
VRSKDDQRWDAECSETECLPLDVRRLPVRVELEAVHECSPFGLGLGELRLHVSHDVRKDVQIVPLLLEIHVFEGTRGAEQKLEHVIS